MTDGWGSSCGIAQKWISLDLTDDKSTLVTVLAWCCKATDHYQSQYCPNSLSLYGTMSLKKICTTRIQVAITRDVTIHFGHDTLCDMIHDLQYRWNMIHSTWLQDGLLVSDSQADRNLWSGAEIISVFHYFHERYLKLLLNMFLYWQCKTYRCLCEIFANNFSTCWWYILSDNLYGYSAILKNCWAQTSLSMPLGKLQGQIWT